MEYNINVSTGHSDLWVLGKRFNKSDSTHYSAYPKEKSLGMIVFASTLSGITDGYQSAQAYKDANGYSADEWEFFCADDLTTVRTKDLQTQYHEWIVEKGEENGKIMKMPLATTISYFLYEQYPSCSTK